MTWLNAVARDGWVAREFRKTCNLRAADLGLESAPTRRHPQVDRALPAADRCQEREYPHLFPAFPGCDSDAGLYTTLAFSNRNCREVADRALQRASGLSGELAVRTIVDAYMGELEAIAEDNRVDVIIVGTSRHPRRRPSHR
jgi:nucleotide-binding universal stress UspA family protein